MSKREQVQVHVTAGGEILAQDWQSGQRYRADITMILKFPTPQGSLVPFISESARVTVEFQSLGSIAPVLEKFSEIMHALLTKEDDANKARKELCEEFRKGNMNAQSLAQGLMLTGYTESLAWQTVAGEQARASMIKIAGPEEMQAAINQAERGKLEVVKR